MAKATSLSSTPCPVGQDPTDEISVTIKVDQSDLDALHVSTGVWEPHPADTLKGVLALVDCVLDDAWRAMKHDLTADDLWRIAGITPDLDHYKPLENWEWLLQCPELMWPELASAKPLAEKIKEWDRHEKWAALRTVNNALAEAARKGPQKHCFGRVMLNSDIQAEFEKALKP